MTKPLFRLASLLALALALASGPDAAAKHRRHARHHHHRRARVVAHYQVTENTPSLGEVALYLYGRADLAPEIARWNHLRRPYRVWVGQRLALRRRPTLARQKGLAKLLAMWRQHLDHGDTAPTRPAEAPQRAPASAPLTPEQMLEQGRGLLDQEHPEEALAFFRKARTQDPNPVQAWLLEFSTLRALKREDELHKSVDLFLESHPAMKGSQVIRLYLTPISRDAS